MQAILFTLILLSSTLTSFTTATAQECPTDPHQVSQKDAVAYLNKIASYSTIASSANKDPQCVDRLIRTLSNDPDAIPTLIEYLDFPAPPSLGSYHMHTPELDQFPAVYALATMENSSEPLLAALASGTLSGLKEHNAVIAYMVANGRDPVRGVKQILAYKPLTGEQKAVALRMHAIAREAAQQCDASDRESCLQLTR